MDLELENERWDDTNLRLPRGFYFSDSYNVENENEECKVKERRKRREQIESSWTQEEIDAINEIHRFESGF